jgi:hypothetical protein
MRERFDKIPDVRDGLTREERVVLYVLRETQKDRGSERAHSHALGAGVRAFLVQRIFHSCWRDWARQNEY